MHPRRVWLTAFAALGAAAARADELSDLPPPAAGAGIERGVALLQCTLPDSEILHLSPLAVGLDLAPVLIAIHVGSELNFDGTRFDMDSVARPLGAAIIAAIDAAAIGASQPPERRRRR